MDQDYFSLLLTHKDIASFLSPLPKQEWTQAITATLLYGVYSLKGNKPAPSTLDEIMQAMRRAYAVSNADSLIPSMKEQLQQMRDEISVLESQLAEKPVEQPKPPGPPAQRVTWKQTDYRRGDDSVFRPQNKPDTAVYPSWWLGLAELNLKQQQEMPTKITQRTPPALPPQKPKKVDFWNQTGSPQPERARWVEVSYQPRQESKAVEANFETSESEYESSAQSSQPSKAPGWVQDYSQVVKKRPGSAFPQSSPTYSSPSAELYRPPQHGIHEPTLKEPLSRGTSSYSSSSVSQRPDDQRYLARDEFNQLLESGVSGSAGRPLTSMQLYSSPYLRNESSEEFKR